MNAPLRFAAKACLVTAASGALCLQVAGLSAQDNDRPSSGSRPAATKIKQAQATSAATTGQAAQSSPQQETDVEKQLKKLYGKKGQEAPSMRLEDAPNTQPQARPPASAGSQSAEAGKPAAPALQPAKPNWFERTFHIGRGRKQAAPANQYAAPTPPPVAPFRYPSAAPAARPVPPMNYRGPTAAPQALGNAAARPVPLVAGPAATAAPAQPQFREPAPLGPTAAPPRALADRGAPPTVRPARPSKDSQTLLDESGMNGDSESLELDSDDDPKIAGQAPQALPSDTADGQAESPYTGIKIAPNETEQQLASSRPRVEADDETAGDPAQADSSAKDAGDAAPKTAELAANKNPGAAVAKKPAKPANDDFDLNDDDEDDDDDDMLVLPRGDSGKHSEVAADKNEKAPEKLVEPAPFSGLKGICPVVLKDNRRLIDAQPGIKSEFHGKTYTFSSMNAKMAFDENPRKYAPVDGGNDVVKQTSGEAGVAGTIEHAAWYRGRLYLFSTADSRHEFVETPSKFVVED
ncbi:MAG TPA: hypothetical protein VGH74_07835 [Planctomycetaceae bacterium]